MPQALHRFYGAGDLHISLAQNLHGDDSLAGSAHPAQDAYDCVGAVVHVRADGVDVNQVNFHPRRLV